MTTNHHQSTSEPVPPSDKDKENPVIGQWDTTNDDGSAKIVVRLGRPQPKPQS